MTQEEIAIDALLRTTVSRLLNAAVTVNRMRDLHMTQQAEAYWLQNLALCEHLEVGGKALTDANTILLRQMGMTLQYQQGQQKGLVH